MLIGSPLLLRRIGQKVRRIALSGVPPPNALGVETSSDVIAMILRRGLINVELYFGKAFVLRSTFRVILDGAESKGNAVMQASG